MEVSSCVFSFSTPLSSSPPSWKCAPALSQPSASHAKFHFSLLSFPLILSKNPTAFVSYIPNPIYNYASTSLRPPSALLVHHAQEVSEDPPISDVALSPEMQTPLPKVDKTGRFCSPRAARELALSTLYAACLQGADPIRLLDKRVNSRMESGYEFEKGTLVEYNHMSFGGPPVTTHTLEEADELLRHDKKESEIEAEVLSAPPKLVYNKLILRLARKILVAVAESWNKHVFIIDKIVPGNWKKDPAVRILELSILHLAMSEIAVLGTRHQIIINEAVDLAKRFCDGAAPRVINGCLRTFVKEYKGSGEAQEDQISRSSPTP